MGAAVSHTPFLTIDKKGRATLPEDVRTALGVREGDFVLLLKTTHGTFELVPATLVPNDQMWFQHPLMRSRVVQAEASITDGTATRTHSATAAQEFLDSLKSPPKASSRAR